MSNKIYEIKDCPCIKYRLFEGSSEILHPTSSAPCYDEFEIEQDDDSLRKIQKDENENQKK